MQNAKIMIVEDESIIAGYIEDILTDAGYKVTATTAAGEEALKLAEKDRPDLVLMDIKLDGEMDGIEAAETIWNLYEIPIIYLTAFSDDIILEKAKLSEPFGYLVKPINKKDLIPAVYMAIHKYGKDKVIREREERYRTIVEENQVEMTLRFVPGGKVTHADEKFSRIMGIKPEEIIGKQLKGTLLQESDDSGRSVPKSQDIIIEPVTSDEAIEPTGGEYGFARERTVPGEKLDPIYKTKAASEMSGVESNLIRTYERLGLISPHRDPDNNYRLFTIDEIEWISRINKLIHKSGLNIEGIKRILTLTECWKLRDCDPTERSACEAYTNANIPCWSVKKKISCCKNRHCYNCRHYVLSRRHPKLIPER